MPLLKGIRSMGPYMHSVNKGPSVLLLKGVRDFVIGAFGGGGVGVI